MILDYAVDRNVVLDLSCAKTRFRSFLLCGSAAPVQQWAKKKKRERRKAVLRITSLLQV
jgi:hypothetical protein